MKCRDTADTEALVSNPNWHAAALNIAGIFRRGGLADARLIHLFSFPRVLG